MYVKNKRWQVIFEAQNTAKSRKFSELRTTILANVKDLDYDVQDLDESINIVKYAFSFSLYHFKFEVRSNFQ